MEVEHALSICYWALWGILLVTFAALNWRILINKKDSRDIYSILTFLFMASMLSIRVSALYPLITKDVEMTEYSSRWEEYVYNGIPLSLFSLTILTHTFRWFMLEAKLTSANSNHHKYPIIIVCITIVDLWKHLFGILFIWKENRYSLIREIYVHYKITFYCVMHISLIIFNMHLLFSFTQKLSNKHPILYNKIKLKLNFYYILMISLLIIRLLSGTILYIELITDGDMILSSYEILTWLITEILPVIVMIFSLVNFGSSSNDDIEDFEERSTILAQSFYNNSIDSYIDIQKVGSINFENSQSFSENSKEQEIVKYSFSDCNINERVKTAVKLNESIVTSESDFSNECITNNHEYTDHATLYPMQKASTSNIEEDIIRHRDSNLKDVFNQMLVEMGVERPSQMTLSATDDND